jgi:hypothetical protein
LRDCSGKAAACARPHHRDPIWVDAELVGMLAHPSQGRHAVVKPGGEGVLRCQPVIRRHDDGAEVACETPGAQRLELWSAHDHPAAVNPQQCRASRFALDRCGDQHAYGRLADVALGHCDAAARPGAQTEQQPNDGQRPLGERNRGERQNRAAQVRRNGRHRVAHRQVASRRKCGCPQNGNRGKPLHAGSLILGT